MSIFGAIKTAIFGDKGPLGGQFSGHKDAPAAPAPAAPPRPAPAPAATASPAAPPAPAPAAPAPAPAPAPVDVAAVLTQKAAASGQPLNWQSSIVDLLKLLDLDSSLAARTALAQELGVHAGADGTPEQNIALHKAVLRELEKSGGTVPAALLD